MPINETWELASNMKIESSYFIPTREKLFKLIDQKAPSQIDVSVRFC